ncbi:MAG TPA: hypothetical protein VNA25_11675 [Phycisphaerae bacterium]|nr:hypothetical protein [Phycisphaerae bacterium]
MTVAATDRDTFRELAQRIAEAAAEPIQAERARLWKDHNSLRPTRPLVMAWPEGAWEEIVPESSCTCSDPLLRQWEQGLRMLVFRHESLPDDVPITNRILVRPVVEIGDFGVEVPYTHGANRGSYVWDAPIKEAKDFDKLRAREVAVDRAESRRRLELVHDLLGDILHVEPGGSLWWTCGLTQTLIALRGLEQSMLDTYDNPELLHRLMAFLRDEMLRFIETLQSEGALSLNNAPDSYVGSGGLGHTDELPADGFDGRVRPKDMWGLGESQEFVGVGPGQFDEFVLQYQLPLMAKLGLVCYGCCEPMDQKLDLVLAKVPNVRRVSISPWSDRQVAAEKLGDRYVYSWKPNPAMVCAPTVDWDFVAKTTRETIELARGCRLEMILKDTHTVCSDPGRFTRWCEIARELAEGA